MAKEAGWYKVGGRAKYWDGSSWMAGEFDLATISEPLRNSSGRGSFYDSVRAQSTVSDPAVSARPTPAGYSTPARREYPTRPASTPPPPPGRGTGTLPPPPPSAGPGRPVPPGTRPGPAGSTVTPGMDDAVRRVGGAGKALRWGVIAFIAIVFGPTIIAFVMDILEAIVDSLE